MIVPRIALLFGLTVATAFPALAAPDSIALGDRDSAWNQVPARLSLGTVLAVEAALADAKDGGDTTEKSVLEGVRDFYRGRRFEPAWFEDGRFSLRAMALRSRMDEAARDGLDPAAYRTSQAADRRYYDPVRLAAVDVDFSRAVARFVMHVASGSIRPDAISRLITLDPERPDMGKALANLLRAPSLGPAIASYEPPHAQYHALKAKLAELRALDEEDDRIVVPEGQLLKPGMAGKRIVLLRKRLKVEPSPDVEPEQYDEPLVNAVKVFQEENNLSIDGIVGPRTLIALNGRSREDDVASIIANMERWRWMPRDLGEFHVFVNVPEFMARVMDDGAAVHETRVIVGKPRNPTPTFSHTISHLVVNPYWNVPASILRNELLPEIRANPYGYLARHGYEVLANVRGRMRLVHPGSVNWHFVNPRALRIRQVPGAHNALGRIKFMFPNQHAVYMHDTPSKALFGRDFRAFSHGCVRVQNPLDFADAILPKAAPEWNSSRLERLYGGQERWVNLDNPVRVHIAYFTTTIGTDGDLNHSEDIYGYDRKMTEFLGS